MSRSPGRSRILTILAVGFLALDGVLLFGAWAWSGRAELALIGVLCLAAAFAVLRLWRQYRRAVDEMEAARLAVQSEVAALREALEVAPPAGKPPRR